MEAAAATAFAGRIAPKLLRFLEANRELRHRLEHDIECIKIEFSMMSARIEEDDDRGWRSGSGGDQVHSIWIQAMHQLAREIEDCLDRFMHRVTMPSWSDHLPRPIRGKFHQAKTLMARNKFAAAIHDLKKRSQELSKLRETYDKASTSSSSSSSSSSSTASSVPSEMETDDTLLARSPVGMDVARDELLELIQHHQQQQQQQLKVISVVGFGGIGKTLLAKHVYDAIKSHYESHAWVRAATTAQGAADVLKEILWQIAPTHKPASGDLGNLQASLRELLGTKRESQRISLQKPFWHHIRNAFVDLGGIVLVTTAIQSVASACSTSTRHDHVYQMTTLANQHSRRLFFKEAFQDDDWPLPNNDDVDNLGSEALKKCDGLPLALVTTARFLQSRGDPTRTKWAKLCSNLGEHLETTEMLARMKRVLVNSYTSLPSHDVKICLLYLGIYPIDRPARRGSLIRRWLAEGFIKGGQEHAMKNFKELVDRSIIIQPTDGSASRCSNNNTQFKKGCHTHGMMLEFIRRKSIRDNFITLLHDQLAPPTPPSSEIRWLSLHHAADREVGDLSHVRSLTVFGKAHESVFKFSKSQPLRVLDLEECDDHLEDKHLKEICSKLLLLRYLSLGATVTATVLPEGIKKLQLLTTLDVRRTNIEILPIQVMELPCLVHLFGKFKLQHEVGGRRIPKLQTFLSKHSKLETVAGFVVDNQRQGFAQLMEHMKYLTKVKIWCESTSTGADSTGSSSNNNNNNLNHLSKAIKAFIKRSTRAEEACSLSLNFNDQWFQDLLLNLSLEKEAEYSCCLRSLKIQGSNKIYSLPPFVRMLASLTKLCLSSPHHQLSRDILVALTRVHGLENLKLVATQLDKFVIEPVAFISLRCLCIVVDFMAELEIQQGALLHLRSLRLLCKDLNGLSGTTIQSLPRLNEVILHDGLSKETKQEWQEAGKNHHRCPKVLFAKTDEEVGVESAENPQSPAAPPSRTKLSVVMPQRARQYVQVVPSEMIDDHKLMGSEHAADIPVAPATVDSTTLSANHDAVTNGQQ